MGGGVSSLPAEVTLAEAKELAGAKWQPAWEEKFADAKISRDEAVKCWKEAEAKSGRSRRAEGPVARRAEALDFSAIVNESAGSTCPARANGSSRRCSAGARTLIARSSFGLWVAAARARAWQRLNCSRGCSTKKTRPRGALQSTPSRRDRRQQRCCGLWRACCVRQWRGEARKAA